MAHTGLELIVEVSKARCNYASRNNLVVRKLQTMNGPQDFEISPNISCWQQEKPGALCHPGEEEIPQF